MFHITYYNFWLITDVNTFKTINQTNTARFFLIPFLIFLQNKSFVNVIWQVSQLICNKSFIIFINFIIIVHIHVFRYLTTRNFVYEILKEVYNMFIFLQLNIFVVQGFRYSPLYMSKTPIPQFARSD